MNFYNEEKFIKWKNILTLMVLTLLSVLLFFKVYVYFEKSIQIITGTIFPFILSFVIVYSLMPFIDMLSENFKMDRKISIFLVLSVFFVFFIYVILAFIPLIGSQLSSFIEFFLKNQEKFQRNLFSFLEHNNLNIRDSIINSKEIIFTNFLKVLNSSVSLLTGTFSLLFMTPIFTIMLIFSYDKIGEGVKKGLKKLNKEELIPLIRQIDEAIGKYIKVTVLDSIIVGICSYVIFLFLKMEYSSLFSIIIGAGNVIPFIGPFIGLIPIILYAATKSFKLVVTVIVLITILQTIEANIVKPWLTSKSVDIHPITTLLVVLIGGALFGIGGAFIAIPVYVVLKLSVIFYFDKLEKRGKIDKNKGI
ncbi:AI-2E family transporter [Leptotrichia sp. OH3620_COT-345]|uniref:AI-2E family transporter n=1 Tax=Leptotrichia sp. OH3620_COT-345 TaxID=2491048 RepID=UPI000F652433|nr:AI-2E family transporter [Leptotrichia sp. OH3620_COT-345]RRD39181.1 AI-2E family transporter [Leptotrichia sp. OH3620_COT-345]